MPTKIRIQKRSRFISNKILGQICSTFHSGNWFQHVQWDTPRNSNACKCVRNFFHDENWINSSSILSDEQRKKKTKYFKSILECICVKFVKDLSTIQSNKCIRRNIHWKCIQNTINIDAVVFSRTNKKSFVGKSFDGKEHDFISRIIIFLRQTARSLQISSKHESRRNVLVAQQKKEEKFDWNDETVGSKIPFEHQIKTVTRGTYGHSRRRTNQNHVIPKIRWRHSLTILEKQESLMQIQHGLGYECMQYAYTYTYTYIYKTVYSLCGYSVVSSFCEASFAHISYSFVRIGFSVLFHVDKRLFFSFLDCRPENFFPTKKASLLNNRKNGNYLNYIKKAAHSPFWV